MNEVSIIRLTRRRRPKNGLHYTLAFYIDGPSAHSRVLRYLSQVKIDNDLPTSPFLSFSTAPGILSIG